MARLKTAVVISGRGSNLKALIDACADRAFPATIVLVVSNVPDAPGLAVAKAAGIATRVVDHREYPSRAEFETALDETIARSNARLVCLAGFMRLLTERFVSKWRDALVNIHPSLLPAFTGLNTHARVLQSGVRFSGCTVHFVRPDMDLGPIIVQAAVPVRADDTVETLAARVLATEHRIYPLAVRLIAENRVRVRGDLVLVNGAVAPEGVLVNPAEDS